MLSDPHQELLEPGTVGADINPPPYLTQTRTAAAELTEEAGHLRGQARDLNERASELHQRRYISEWTRRADELARVNPREVLEELAALGFAWRDIARLVAVSVPAVQKWRRGERPTGENRKRLADLLAACHLIHDHYGVQEVASWFEVPLQVGFPVTPMDLWISKQGDLVFELANGHTNSEGILTNWDPRWRERYHSDFETFRSKDGLLSVRPKTRQV